MSDDKIKQNSISQDIQIAKLEYVGAALASLGVGIKLIAAGLAVDVLEKLSIDAQSKQAKSMQKQIDYIINELQQIKQVVQCYLPVI